ncbi:MAG: hypothetical protein LBE92_18680 [Chryseobacterium sp.]|jgi:hypothetical protein|uniref:hypothetical protein n=1 Tax=Chryseobacterium sp. TaxID=1871047 RepID=UPI002823F5DE|nr:hypothetical protein [Chryseobacterium sp.]MDR2238154.1 hypothetical protein [Chryseobacterium sp.]
MSIPLNTIYSYFETGDFPTQEQFQASWSSFWHKDESIPTGKVTGLENLLQNKVDKQVYELHLSDPEAHAAFLAKRNASNLSESDKQAWKEALNVGELPDNVATVDSDPLIGNVYTKIQSKDQFMMIDDYVNTEGKITADKLEALALTRIIKVREETIDDFIYNSDAYQYEDSDIVAIPYYVAADTGDNDINLPTIPEPQYTLYFYIGGDKKNVNNYLNTGVSTVSISMVKGLQGRLDSKVDKPLSDGIYQIERKQGVTSTIPVAVETLASVMNRNNYAPRGIAFTEETDGTGIPGKEAVLVANPATYSFSFGNINPAHTGVYNIAVGYNNMPALTEGASNTVIGHFAAEGLTTGGANVAMGLDSAKGLTTGNDNTLIGVSAGYGIEGGSGNTMLGKWTGCNIKGNNNTFLGYQAGLNWGKGGSGKWSSNIVIGANTTGHPMGVWGENSIIIGSNLELNGQQYNKFIINNFTAKDNNYYKTHFIEGNFADRWLRFDTSLQVLRMPAADASYTKNIVARPDGTFGTEDKVDYVPLNGTRLGKPLNGSFEFSNESLGMFYCGPSVLNVNDGAISMVTNNSNVSVTASKVSMANGFKSIDIDSSNSHIDVKSDLRGPGLLGADYYGYNYQPNSFVQKQWVDEKLQYATKKPYEVYTALIQFTEDGKFDPVFIDLENTIGDIEWKHDSQGRYLGLFKEEHYGNWWIDSKINYYDKDLADCRAVKLDNSTVALDIFRVLYSRPIELSGNVGIIEIRLYPGIE